MKKYTTIGCMRIMAAAYKNCLLSPNGPSEIKTRINYVKNNPAFLLWCAIDGHNAEALRNLAIVKNHGYLKKWKEKSLLHSQ